MRRTTITPTGRKIAWGEDEVIVSKTDPKGVITYANETFARVAGYTRAELVGAPGRIVGYHSWRRHPERSAIAEIEKIHDLMRAAEARHTRTVDAAEASLALVGRVLADAGVTYDQFVWDLIARTTPELR